MKVFKVTDKEFKPYGQILEDYDFNEIFETAKKLPIPDNEIIYETSLSSLERCKVKEQLQNRGFGGLKIQIGYVGGVNRTLNCLEYHKSSEFNIALDDIILVLGLEGQIENGYFSTDNCKAFFVPKGTGVELYGTTLHYAPMNVNDNYRVLCVLPKGTNGKKPKFDISNIEDKMCFGNNKWIMCHPDSPDAKIGVYQGLKGDNITFLNLEF